MKCCNKSREKARASQARLVIQSVKWYIFLHGCENALKSPGVAIQILSLSALIILVHGCSSGNSGMVRPVQRPPIESAADSVHPMAIRHFIDGSVHEMRGDFANAILEYQDALRFSKASAIYYALAKCYSSLGKHALAIESGRMAVQGSPAAVEYRRALADVYVASFQIDSAAQQYEEIVRRDSGDVQAWFSLGRLYEGRKPLRALDVYEKMMQRFGPEWTVLLQVAELYNKQGQFDKAAGALQKMKDLDPANQALQRTLAQTYVRARRYSPALGILNELRDRDSSNVEYIGDIGEIYLLQKEYEKAATQFENILSRDSVSVDAKIKIGQLYYDQIEKDSTLLPMARRLFDRIRRAHPKDWRPYWFLGAMASMAHDDSAAAGYFRSMTEVAPWNADGWVFLASTHLTKNDFSGASGILEEGRKHVPEDFRINFFLGVAYNRLGRQQDAARSLEKARRINPKDLEAIAELALVYDGLNRHEDSDSLYEEGLREKPDNHLMLNNYGYSLAERGKQLDRALEMATRAVESQPNNASYLDTKGWVLFRLGRYEEAEKFLAKALEQGEPSAAVYEHMGDVSFMLKDAKRALDFWKKAQVLDPKNAAVREKLERGSL
jgi:tetratricopeptide (TPR) repeat protein